MDPLSVAASVAGLISLTLTVTKATTDYVSSFRHAPEESVQLAGELSALAGALDSLSRFLTSRSADLKPFSSTSTLVSTTSSCRSSLEALQATLQDFIKASQGRRWYKRLAWPLKKDDHVRAVSTIQRFTQIFHFSLSIDGCELLSKTTDEIATIRHSQAESAEDVSELVDLVGKLDLKLQDWTLLQQQQVTKIHQGQKDQAQQLLLEWLSASTDPSINHNRAIEKREPETGNWFLESDEYFDWLSKPGFIWLRGIPGCGKTVLCSTIIEATKEICATSTSSKLAFFYFDFQRSTEHSVVLLLRSLLRQVCADDLEVPAAVQELYTKYNQTGHQPSTKDLESALLCVIDLGKDIYIILDALDEVPENTGISKRVEVLKLIEKLVALKRPNLHILVTSRDESDIRSRLGPLSNGGILIQGSTVDEDIRRYVRSSLMEDDRLRKLEPRLKDMIETTLGEKAKGMFRWAFCQMEDIRICRRPSDIKRVLAGLPTTLDETYERLLAEMSKHDAEEGLSILGWMVFAGRPLTLQEVAEAAVIRPGNGPVDPDDRLFDASEVLRICRSLISVSSQIVYMLGDRSVRDIMIFSHYSIQEYLLSGRSEAFSSWSRSAHRYIGDCCLSSLLQLTEPELTAQDVEENPILNYASEHWYTHARKVDNHADRALLLGHMHVLFDKDQPMFYNWLRLHEPRTLYRHRYDKAAETFSSPLFYASHLGFYDVAVRLIEAGAAVNERPKNSVTPLHVAARAGEKEIVQLLLDYGANVNAHCWEDGTPLQEAVVGGHKQIVRLLLSHGADANGPSSSMFDSILQAALEHCHTKETASRMANILLDHGADVTRPGKFYRAALTIACRYGLKELVQRIVGAGADVNAPGNELYGSALQQAAYHGHAEIVRWLLEKVADVKAPGDRRFGSALQGAARSGNLQILNLLVERGADIEALGGFELSALQTAARRGHTEIVSRLLDLGANINQHGGDEDDAGAALKVASEKGHDEVVRLLLGRGASINFVGGQGKYSDRGTALQGASSHGHLDVVQLPIEAGADVNLPGRDYGTALQAAARSGHVEIVQLLLAHGAMSMHRETK